MNLIITNNDLIRLYECYIRFFGIYFITNLEVYTSVNNIKNSSLNCIQQNFVN